jgi:hypothetical protein
MGGLVLAMIAGVLVPVVAVLAVASRTPLPRDCATGQATSTTLEGALADTTGSDLWYSEGFPGHPRKLVDYAPPRSLPTLGVSPSPTAAPAAPLPQPSPSPSPLVTPARILAADVSSDRKLVAFIVLDPPDRPGYMALELMSPVDAPGTQPVSPWYDGQPDRGNLAAVEVHILDSGKVLLFEPQTTVVAAPSPAPAEPPPASSPSPSAPPAAHASPSLAARVVGSPSVQAVIVAPGATPGIVDHGSQRFLFSQGLAAWMDARGYRAPALLPEIGDRVDAPSARVAGIVARELGTPLVSRRLRELVLGTAGRSDTHPVCTLEASVVPEIFSPDGSELALRRADQTLLIDLSGNHAATHLLSGRLLAWRS